MLPLFYKMPTIELTETTLVLPKVEDSDNTAVFDMRDIHYALSRQDDLASVTIDKAQELMGVFLKGLVQSKRYLAVARHKLERAKVIQRRVHALLSRDKIPTWIEERKLKDTERTVNMFVVLDPEYQAAEEMSLMLAAIVEDLEGKAKAMEFYHQAVKKVYNEWQPGNQNLSGPRMEGLGIGEGEKRTTVSFKIGNPKYRGE